MKTMKTNNLGKKYLVEQCQRINITDYNRQAKNKIKELLINSQIELGGEQIELTTSQTNYKGTRYWFKCPICSNRVGVLFKHPISQILGCRMCLGLEYRCRRYKGMVESMSLKS